MTGSERPFLDTNVVLYALGADETKRTVARELLALSPVISVQVLSEASSVLSRKSGMAKPEIATRLGEIRSLASEIRDLNLAVLSRAWRLWQANTVNW